MKVDGTTTTKRGAARVNELDLLRILAALAVVFFHYSFRGFAGGISVMPYPWLAPVAKYGYLGVELFFIISGFVILMTAAKGTLRSFLISRVVRLYPAFWACCTISVIAMALLGAGAPRFSVSLNRYLVNMTMFSGFVGVDPVDGAYWSLFVEMRFYALVAIALVLGGIRHSQRLLIVWLAASILLASTTHLSRFRPYVILDYSAYFIAGATYFLIWSQGLSLTRMTMILLSCGLALFQSLHSLGTFEQDYNVGASHYAVAVIVIAFFVVMFLISTKRTGAFGRLRWPLAGAVSYPLYLLHQNIGYVIFNSAYPAINPHLLLFGTVAVVLGAAYAVHVMVERRLAPRMKGTLMRAGGLTRT